VKGYRVRDGSRQLTFHGELLGEASSRRPESDRWFDLRIFRTEAGRYIVEGVGRSSRPGEVDLSWVKLCDTPEDVVRGLYRVDNTGVLRLTTTAQQALDLAARKDKGFAVTLVA